MNISFDRVNATAYWQALGWLLILPALGVLHSFIVYSLLAFSEATPVTTDDNIWLEVALSITLSNPDVLAAKARSLRIQALLPAAPTDILEQQRASSPAELLNESLMYWKEALVLRTNWPYYALGALDVEVILDKPALDIQHRVDSIILMAPNERGLDRSLLELSFIRWNKLTDQQKTFMLTRLDKVGGSTLNLVYAVAKKAGTHQAICLNLPWKKVKKLCRKS